MEETKKRINKERVLITINKEPYIKLKKTLEEWKLSFSELVDEWVDLTNDAIEGDGKMELHIKKPTKVLQPIKKEEKEVDK